jgi:hypothetical protein
MIDTVSRGGSLAGPTTQLILVSLAVTARSAAAGLASASSAASVPSSHPFSACATIAPHRRLSLHLRFLRKKEGPPSAGAPARWRPFILNLYRRRLCSVVGVLPEIDIWRAAQLMLKRDGERALEESAARDD